MTKSLSDSLCNSLQFKLYNYKCGLKSIALLYFVLLCLLLFLIGTDPLHTHVLNKYLINKSQKRYFNHLDEKTFSFYVHAEDFT
uniref:Uncharacterized protein n=1 Tax=Pararge aegeria TaxID=116150 RepID=S4PJK5_9NEOP